MRLYNALSGQVEDFVPLHPGEVRMYACGLTVTDDAHLGHGRGASVFDLLRRVFRYRGLRVLYVRNITDVDDKIIARAKEKGVSPEALAETYRGRYYEDMERLRVPRAEIEPRASEHVPEMVAFVEALLARGAAYERDGDVLFRVAGHASFGVLARTRGREVERGDFLLWKAAAPGEPAWPSPWGPGRPGWHIECSAMSTRLLGDTFDLHGGGDDLMHPHHDAEIAQCEARSGKAPARFFTHNGLVLLSAQKMSKSVGNFFTLREIYARWDPAAVRRFLFGTHYREPVTFSPEAMDAATRAVTRLDAFLRASAAVVGRAPKGTPSPSARELAEAAKQARGEILAALEDDLDTPRALRALDRVLEAGEAHLASGAPDPLLLGKVEETLDSMDELFDFRPEHLSNGARTGELVETILRVRRRLLEDASNARAAREIADALSGLGIEIIDTPWGTRWRWE